MQKIATKVFIGASIVFGLTGIFMAISGVDPDNNGTMVQQVVGKLFLTSVFVILTSFALSVASKYLGDK